MLKPFVKMIILSSMVSACTSVEELNCFDLSKNENGEETGTCSAEGFFVKSFEDYFFEKTEGDPKNFIILNFGEDETYLPGLKDGSKYRFYGTYTRLEGRIYRLEIDSSSSLMPIS